MGCFIVPATGAVISHFAKKHADKSQNNTLSRRLGWLTNLLAGGSLLLAFEHVWHGEVTYAFPFLTSENLLEEMATAGVAMLVLCLAVWGAMIAVANAIEKRDASSEVK